MGAAENVRSRAGTDCGHSAGSLGENQKAIASTEAQPVAKSKKQNRPGPARSLGQSKSRAKAGEKGCLASLKQKVRASFRPLSFLLPKLVVVREHEG